MKKLMMLVVAMWAGCAVAWGGWFNQPANGLSGKTNVVVMTLPNGSKTIETMDDGRIVVTVVTNGVNCYVSATNGAANYNGPDLGLEFALSGWDAGDYIYWVGGAVHSLHAYGNTNSMYAAHDFRVLMNGQPELLFADFGFTSDYTHLPAWRYAIGESVTGAFCLSWVQVTNAVTYYPMTDGLTTNRTIQAGDVLRFEHGLLKGVE